MFRRQPRIFYIAGYPSPGPDKDPKFGLADVEKKSAQAVADKQAGFNKEIAGLTKSYEDKLTQLRIMAWRGETARENITRTAKGLAIKLTG